MSDITEQHTCKAYTALLNHLKDSLRLLRNDITYEYGESQLRKSLISLNSETYGPNTTYHGLFSNIDAMKNDIGDTFTGISVKFTNIEESHIQTQDKLLRDLQPLIVEVCEETAYLCTDYIPRLCTKIFNMCESLSAIRKGTTKEEAAVSLNVNLCWRKYTRIGSTCKILAQYADTLASAAPLLAARDAI